MQRSVSPILLAAVLPIRAGRRRFATLRLRPESIPRLAGGSVEHRENVAIHGISYASPKGGRVLAYLVVPNGTGLFAAVICGHWYWGNSATRKPQRVPG
jgi:hypothetical protein